MIVILNFSTQYISNKLFNILKVLLMKRQQLYQQQALSFKDRIINTLKLSADEDLLVSNIKKLAIWVQKCLTALNGKQAQGKQVGLMETWLSRSSKNTSEKQSKKQDSIKWFEALKSYIEQAFIPLQFSLNESIQVPSDIEKCLKKLKGVKLPKQKYYGRAKGPNIADMLIKNKQDLNKNIEKVTVNGLKFIVIQQAVADKYQRNLIQQVFGRIFRHQGFFSVVIKIEIENGLFECPSSLFIYIQDVQFRDRVLWKSIDNLVQGEIDEEVAIYIQQDGKKIKVNQKNLIETFLGEMFVVPLQTLLPRFIVFVRDGQAFLVKHHDLEQQISHEQTAKLKSHPSIRNPLIFFKNFIQMHKFDIDLVNSIVVNKDLFAGFYKALEVIIRLIYQDFSFERMGVMLRATSFTSRSFKSIWDTFHSIELLSNWLEQVVRPVRDYVTLSQIIQRFCPIFNYVSKFNTNDVKSFRNLMNNLQIQTYMTTYIPKTAIKHYNNLFNGFQEQATQIYTEKSQIFKDIFLPTLQQLDLQSYNKNQIPYILCFFGKFNQHLETLKNLSKSWRNRKIWKAVYRNLQKNKLQGIDFHLDMIGYQLGLQTILIAEQPLQLIRFQTQDEQFLKCLKRLLQQIRKKNQKGNESLMSLLLQKFLKYNKLQGAQIMLEQNAKIVDYSEVFEQQMLDEKKQKRRNQLIKSIKDKNPEMYRRYKWQHLMRVELKYSEEGYKSINTIDFGKCWFKKQIYDSIFNQGSDSLPLNVSRKDYMYGTKDITKVVLRQGVQYYIERSEYPMVPKFYKSALNMLGVSHIIPNYTLFMHQKGVFRISECIQGACTFEKCLDSFPETDIKYLLSDNLLSQGIIISMLFLPQKLTLKDLIMKPSFTEATLFVINFKEFYQKSPIIKQGDQFILKSKNCFFVMDAMHKTITSQIMKKYIQIDILAYANQLFTELSEVTEQMTKLKKAENLGNQHKQLLGMIFEKQFIVEMCKRFFKIQNAFKHCLKNNVMMSHMEILEMLSPQLSYFYEQIISSSNSLKQRQKFLMDNLWTKPFVKKQSLFSFMASSSKAVQPLNLFPSHYKKFCFCGPSQSLAFLNENKVKFAVFDDNFLTSKWNLQNAETVQFYIQNLRLSDCSKQEKELFFNKVKQKSVQYLKEKSNTLPLKYIKINSMELIKQSNNVQNFSYQRVQQLYFQECKFPGQFFSTLNQKISNVSELTLKKIQNLQMIGTNSFQSSSLQFKNVRILSVSQCHQLVYMDIKCDILECLVVRDNKQLQNIYINSNNLKTINCNLNPKLGLQNIGVYILRGINVLLCKTSCFGDAKKLYDEKYDIYLVKILKFMLSRFQDQQGKNNMFITMAKLGYFKEKISTFLSATNLFSTISSFVLKFSPQIEEDLIVSLLQLFLKNPFIESLYFNYITSIKNVKLFKYFLKALKKIDKTKPLKQLFLHSLDYEGLKDSVQIFMELNFDKHFILTVQNISQKDFDDKISLLKVLLFSNSSIEKVTAHVKNTSISSDLFNSIFMKQLKNNQHGAIQSKLNKVILQNCQLIAQLQSTQQGKNVKQFSLSCCLINNISVLKSVKSLKTLKLFKTQIHSPLELFYSTLKDLQDLQTFHFIGQKQKIKNLDISGLLQALGNLKRLEQLDLSSNQFTIQDTYHLNQFLQKQGQSVQRLTLNNFYSIQEDQRKDLFRSFLKNCSVKMLKIQILHEQEFKVFVDEISRSKKLVKLQLNTPFILPSALLEPLNQNKVLQQIKSNQLLPMWLKNHLQRTFFTKSKLHEMSDQILLPSKTTDYFKVGLSLDGGGTRGILIAAQLQYLEKQIGYPIYKIFDYVGGTSIGGILTLGCTGTLDGQHPICYASDLVGIFENYGNVIFPKSQIRNIVNIFDTKYSPIGVQSVLKNYFKDAKLSDVLQQTNAVVTAVSRVDNRDVIFKSMDAILHRDKDFYIRDIARATSAAPTYFPSAEIKNIDATVKLSLMDGGVGLNNPSKLVIDQIKKMAFNYGYQNNFFLLSMGTGRLQTDVIPQKAGIVNVAGIIDSFGESSNYFLERDLQDNYKGHFLRVQPQIDRPRKQVELDSSDTDLMNYYKEVAYVGAKKFYSNAIVYGKYRNLSLVDWLRENTEKKLEE